MNKSILLFSIFIFLAPFSTPCFGQVNFEFSFLTNDTEDGVVTYFFDLKDLDGDGDLDAISSSFFGSTLTWNENINGAGEFGPSIDIDQNDNGSYTVQGSDIDGDGDNDVLTSIRKNSENVILWYENLDGNGSFDQGEVIYTHDKNIRKLSAEDVDNDGDMDVVFIEDTPQSGQTTGCFVLINENGNFEIKQVYESEGTTWDFIFEDISNDGQNDIVVVDINVVAVIENAGDGTFLEAQEVFELNEVFSIKAYDLDNDNDLDFLVTKVLKSTVVLENLGDMNFAFADEIEFGIGNYGDVFGININGDEYIDFCLPTNQGLHTILNSGQIDDIVDQSDFHPSDDFTGYKIQVADLNKDSREDVVACSISHNNLGIYTNMTIPTQTKNETPFNGSLSIRGNYLDVNSEVNIDQVRIFNSIGQLAMNSNGTKNIDISSLVNGIYFCQIMSGNQAFTSQFYVVR